MKKKVIVNLDTFIVLVLIFVFSFGFIAYQRYQYSDLLKSHNALLFETIEMDYLKAKLAECVGK